MVAIGTTPTVRWLAISVLNVPTPMEPSTVAPVPISFQPQIMLTILHKDRLGLALFTGGTMHPRLVPMALIVLPFDNNVGFSEQQPQHQPNQKV